MIDMIKKIDMIVKESQGLLDLLVMLFKVFTEVKEKVEDIKDNLTHDSKPE